jgi:hypothetical protein
MVREYEPQEVSSGGTWWTKSTPGRACAGELRLTLRIAAPGHYARTSRSAALKRSAEVVRDVVRTWRDFHVLVLRRVCLKKAQ